MDEERKEYEDEDILDLAIQNEYENSTKFELGSQELTKSNNTLAALYKAKGEILKTQNETELKLAEIEAEDKKDKRQTRQRYVQTGCMVGVAALALFADSDSWIGRVNNKVLGFATKLIFKG